MLRQERRQERRGKGKDSKGKGKVGKSGKGGKRDKNGRSSPQRPPPATPVFTMEEAAPLALTVEVPASPGYSAASGEAMDAQDLVSPRVAPARRVSWMDERGASASRSPSASRQGALRSWRRSPSPGRRGGRGGGRR